MDDRIIFFKWYLEYKMIKWLIFGHLNKKKLEQLGLHILELQMFYLSPNFKKWARIGFKEQFYDKRIQSESRKKEIFYVS